MCPVTYCCVPSITIMIKCVDEPLPSVTQCLVCNIYTYIYVASSVLLPPSHPRPPCMTQLMTARSDQVSTISDISPLFGKTSHHSGHYSFTALKLSQSWIPCCPLRPVDGAEMAQPHTAEIFVFKLCRITIFDSGISVKEVRSEVPADTEELCCPGTYQHL